ncbi:MarR family transcriptional regulator [Rhodobacteraceae bacterium NNCM2]|nr:MarR family transcriptional regulator [Coraliihabitans acroporae]
MKQPADKTSGPLDHFLCFSAYSVAQAFNRLYRPLLEKLGLTYPQYLVMQLLWAEDGQAVKDIGGVLSLESNTLTPLLKRLQSNGLVERERDAEDERVVRIRLTSKGRALEREAATVPDCVADAIGLERAEREKLAASLDALRTRLTRAAEA